MKRWIPAALAAALVLGICACDDDEGPTQPPSSTVEGRVLDLVGQPVGGVAVLVSGKPPVTTASDGSFTVADVASTYDVTVIFSTHSAALVYKGVSRRDPVLSYLEVVSVVRSATISGNVPPAPTRRSIVFFVSGEVSERTVADPTTGSYTLTPEWYGATTALSGKLYVLRWSEGVGGLPDDFDGYAVRDQTISDAGSFSVDFGSGDLANPAEDTIGGSVAVPAGYTLATLVYGLDFGMARVSIADQLTSSPDFTFTVPDLPEVEFTVWTQAGQTTATTPRMTIFARKGIAGGTTGISVAPEEAPQLSLPVHQATGVTNDTPFVWSPGGGTGVTIFVATPHVGSNPRYYVMLIGSTVQIPDLSGQGLGLPAGAGYDWRLVHHVPVASMDVVTSESFSPSLGVKTGDAGTAYSEVFEFTTEP